MLFFSNGEEKLMTKKNIYFIYFLLTGIILTFYYFPILQGKVLIGDDYRLKQNFFLNWDAFYGFWKVEGWLGAGNFYWLFITENIVQLFLPEFNGFSTSMTFFVLSVLLLIASYHFFRSLQFAILPSLVGSLVFTFSPIYYTYIRAGHTWKLFTIVYFVFTFVCINKIWYNQNPNKTKKFIYNAFYVLFGALTLCLGLIHIAYQTYAYLIPVLALYCLFLFFNYDKQKITLRQHFEKNRQAIISIIIIPLIFLAIGYKPLDNAFSQLTGRNLKSLFFSSHQDNHNPIDKSLVGNQEKKTLLSQTSANPLSNVSKKNQDLAKWDWATQWSLPKLETLDFFVPGVFGFLSNDSENPYWGGVGRSLAWDKTKQGLFNYSLTSHYLGIFLGIFLLYAFFFVDKRLRWLWGFLIIFNLLLSYGRYFPLYEFFYNFPHIEKLRNPNKFLLVVYFCSAIFAVYGINDFYQKLKIKKKNPQTLLLKESKFFKIFLIAANVFLLVILLYVITNNASIKTTFNHYFNNNASIVNLAYENIIFYLIKALFFYNAMLYLLYHLATKKIPQKRWKPLIILAVVFLLLDQFLVNYHYFNFTTPVTQVKDPLLDFFKEKEEGPFRVKIISPNSNYLQYFKWTLARDNDIDIMEYYAIRSGKIPERDANYLKKINNNDLRVYKLANVKYLLANQPIEHPEINLAHSFTLSSKEEIFVYEIKNTLPRFYLVDQAKVIGENEDLLSNLNSADFNIYTTALYQASNQKLTEEKWKPFAKYLENYNYSDNETAKGNASFISSVQLLANQGLSEYDLAINLDKPKILVFLNPNNGNWRAYHQGKEINRALPAANYYFNSYLVEPSMKEVTLKFHSKKPVYPRSSVAYFVVTILLLLIFQLIKIRAKD